jgi:hypothetical protein
VDERALVAQQLGRPPRAFRRVARRCPFGRPAVTEQAPFDDDGAPFPTTYYLTCRHLVAALARVEAAGGVERWSAETQRDPALAASRAWADEEQRRLRRALAELRGDVGARAVLRAAPRVTFVEMPEAAIDIDTPQDLERWR